MERDRETEWNSIRPGRRSLIAVFRLLGEALLDLLLLPFRLMIFLVNRKKVSREIADLVEGCGKKRENGER